MDFTPSNADLRGTSWEDIILAGNQKFEPASTPWVDMLRQFLTREFTAEDLDGVSDSLSWEVTSPPPHLLRDEEETIGFSIRLIDGQVEVRDALLPGANISIVIPYDVLIESFHNSNEEEVIFMKQAAPKLVEEGKLVIAGSPGPLQKLFIKHNVRERFYNIYTI
ncbi:hypothetical protein [Sphingobium sp. CFD-2]|uniref:hypothetical protein n=1 Tax=Sphingobium sp. CFD-2 TaxID=2878542 RepID=UPI00214AAC0A|nr:hypothetical protein [Sphingobium sp. CFD-2]